MLALGHYLAVLVPVDLLDGPEVARSQACLLQGRDDGEPVGGVDPVAHLDRSVELEVGGDEDPVRDVQEGLEVLVNNALRPGGTPVETYSLKLRMARVRTPSTMAMSM